MLLELLDKCRMLWRCHTLAQHVHYAVGVAYLSFTWTLEHGGKSCWLEELYVMPAYRKRGIGRQLLDAGCQRAVALAVLLLTWR